MTYTLVQQMIEFKHALNQGEMECIKLPEAASQSATHAGDLVYLVNGAITICGNDAATVYGIMVEDCEGTTGDLKLVNRIRTGDVYEANVVTGHTPGTDIFRGCKYGLDRTGTANWEIDATATTYYGAIVLDYVGTPASGSRVLFTFNPAVIQSEIGA